MFEILYETQYFYYMSQINIRVFSFYIFDYKLKTGVI